MAISAPNNRALGQKQISRAIARISHEILERNGDTDRVILVGIHSRGVPLANRLAEHIEAIEGKRPPVGSLDIGLYRDDISKKTSATIHPTDIPVQVDGRSVVLVDDVLYTGRTIRAAMDALNDFGRPKRIQVAVLIDRGHRELPIRADYVGKNIPTAVDQLVHVRIEEVDGVNEVIVRQELSS